MSSAAVPTSSDAGTAPSGMDTRRVRKAKRETVPAAAPAG
jgi:hypothetical protein